MNIPSGMMQSGMNVNAAAFEAYAENEVDTMTDARFTELLESVPGSYDDFVGFLVRNVTKDNERQMVAEFIESNPEKNAGYVLEFYTDNLWNEDEDD